MSEKIMERLSFPVKSKVLRRYLINHDERCPECGQFSLDVGNECTSCGFDAMPEVRDFPQLTAEQRLQNLTDAVLKDMLEIEDKP